MYNRVGVNLKTIKKIDKSVFFCYYFHAVKGIPHRQGYKHLGAP